MTNNNLDIPEVAPAPINMEKATREQLVKEPIVSGNAASITKAMLAKEKKVLVKIASTEHEKHAVYVAINGVNRLIPRDKWFPIEPCFVQELENCQQAMYTVKLMDGRSETIEEEVGRFSISSKSI